jgi:hypothetical protein
VEENDYKAGLLNIRENECGIRKHIHHVVYYQNYSLTESTTLRENSDLNVSIVFS